MAFHVAHFNILGKHMAGTMWFHYARDFLPAHLATTIWDWSRPARFPKSLLWSAEEGPGRFHRLPVLLVEIRALMADVLCLVELDCFEEFQAALAEDGYDAVFQARPGKRDGCGIFWKRDSFCAVSPATSMEYTVPARDRIALGQLLRHHSTGRELLAVSTHLHYDQAQGHQVAEAQELLEFVRAETGRTGAAAVICADLNSLPESETVELLESGFSNASGLYPNGAFTSLTPDRYYYAAPAPRGPADGSQDRSERWHFQEGRREVLDYVFFDEHLLLETPAAVPCLPAPHEAERPWKRARGTAPFGFWAGGWDFTSSPAEGFEEGLADPDWQPKRSTGDLQLGLPNRLHGSDHVPLVCSLRFGDESGGEGATL